MLINIVSVLACVVLFVFSVFLFFVVLIFLLGLGLFGIFVFFFKQKTAYEMRIMDWSSDVCSSDLLLDRSEAVFRRNALKGIVIARYIGPIRPFVPAVAGMARMPIKRYLPASALAAVTWALLFLVPGWLLGHAYDAVAAVANRLALAIGGLAVVLALAWAAVLHTYRWFARHADSLLARALRWTRMHPRLGRYAAAMIDPNRPESASLLILAVCLLAIGVAWFALLGTVLMRSEPLALDRAVYETMLTLRNPLADRLMAGLASIGDAMVLVPAIVLTMAWLLWRKRWLAAAHWLAALAFGLVLTALLGAVVDMPNPPTAPLGFGFPSIAVTMATITFGFFAVLIAREMPGRRRVWPYLVSGAVVAVLGFARLYLGAHWLSDVVGGMMFGIVWLLVLGLAYRRHVARSFWTRPPALVFYITFLAAALWHAPRALDTLLERFAPPEPAMAMSAEPWWRDGWTRLPAPSREKRTEERRVGKEWWRTSCTLVTGVQTCALPIYVRHRLAAGAGARVPAPRGALVLDAAAGAGVLHHLPGRGAVACAARDRHAARALRAAGAGHGHERRTVVARRLDPPARAAQGERSHPALAPGHA